MRDSGSRLMGCSDDPRVFGRKLVIVHDALYEDERPAGRRSQGHGL
jgi:hypothetical protein